MAIVAFLEVSNGRADLLNVPEDAAVNRLVLQRLVKAFGDTVGLGLGDEGEARGNAPELDPVEEVVSGVLRPVVHAQGQPTSGTGADRTKFGVAALGDRLQGSKAMPVLTAWIPTQQASKWSTAENTQTQPSSTVSIRMPSVPHISFGRSVVIVPSCRVGTPWGRRCGESSRVSRIRRNTCVRETRMSRRMRSRAQTMR
jgi:hypothetical protein